jgi:hypothetical protein
MLRAKPLCAPQSRLLGGDREAGLTSASLQQGSALAPSLSPASLNPQTHAAMLRLVVAGFMHQRCLRVVELYKGGLVVGRVTGRCY